MHSFLSPNLYLGPFEELIIVDHLNVCLHHVLGHYNPEVDTARNMLTDFILDGLLVVLIHAFNVVVNGDVKLIWYGSLFD